MATTNPARQGAREVYGDIGITTPNGDQVIDDVNDAVRVNLVAGAGSGGTSATDDAAFTVGSGTGTPIMGYAAADNVDAGDVGVVRMTVGRALFVNLRDSSGTELSVGGGTQYNEDDAHTSGDKVTMAGIVRKDTAAQTAGTDGDICLPIADASGRLWVNASGAAVPVTDNSGSLTVDNAALSVTGGGVEATALRVTIASDSTGVLSVDDNGSTISVDDGAGSLTIDNSTLAVVGNGTAATAMRVTIASDTTGVVAVTDNAGSLTIDNATLSVVGNGAAATALRVSLANDSTGIIASIGTSVTPGTAAANLGKAEDAAHASGDTGVFILGVRNDAQTTFAGTDADYSPIAVDPKGNLMVGGNIAHDGVDAGNPVKIGMRALAHGANPTAVAAADRSDWLCNRAGVPWVIGGHPNVITKEFTFAAADGAQTNAALISVSAGTKLVITMIDAVASSANTVDVAVRIGLATATLSAAATTGITGIVLSHKKLAPGSGLVKGNGSGIIAIGADDEDLRITSDSPTSGHITVTVTYYTIES